MAGQQAWDDWTSLKQQVVYLDNITKIELLTGLVSLKDNYEAIILDQERVANAAALADTNPTYNAAYMMEKIGKYLALKTFLEDNGYFA